MRLSANPGRCYARCEHPQAARPCVSIVNPIIIHATIGNGSDSIMSGTPHGRVCGPLVHHGIRCFGPRCELHNIIGRVHRGVEEGVLIMLL